MDDRGAITLTSGSDGDHELTTWQRLPLPLGKVFDFFSDATNLGSLTPASLRFRLATSVPIEMRAGATIDYRLRVRGFPVRWQSEISGWEPPHRFVDVQRRGPYRLCRHEHAFREDDDGTVVFDHVRYRAPGGPLVSRLVVGKDLEGGLSLPTGSPRRVALRPEPGRHARLAC